MTPFERPDRRCPKCEHKGYLFRAGKNLELPEGKFVETKYRCRSCSMEWWERPAGQRRAGRLGRRPPTRSG